MQDPAAGSPWIVDVEERDFQREVVERSREVPVVVDFWAPWCGPCRTLGPLLERLAEEHAGAFVLAKVDVDRAPGVAGQLGVRSVPTVLGLRDGAVRAEFVGAQPEPAVRDFLARVLPSRADERAAEALAKLEAGDADAAEALLRQVLDEEPRHGRALLGLARIEAGRGELDAALDRLERVLPHEPVAAEAEHLAAELRVRREGGSAAPEEIDALAARVEADPDDLDARLALGRALAAAGRHEASLAALLEVVRRDPAYRDDAARKAMLDQFELLGGDHALTQRFRAELGRALFR